jgi:hypothetical protein
MSLQILLVIALHVSLIKTRQKPKSITTTSVLINISPLNHSLLRYACMLDQKDDFGED